jgi:hypothetical protein
MNGANVVVSSHHRAGKTFQNDAESSRRDIKATRLEPDAIRVRHPETIVFQVNVRDEVFAAPSIWLEAVGETAKGIDRHISIEPGIERGVNVFQTCFPPAIFCANAERGLPQFPAVRSALKLVLTPKALSAGIAA